MGQAYAETLRTSTDFTFWRGLVDDLDLEGIIGAEGDRQYIDFVVLGKTRTREYLDTLGSTGGESSLSGSQSYSESPCF